MLVLCVAVHGIHITTLASGVDLIVPHLYTGFPDGASGKESACQCRRYKRHRFDPWVRKIPWRRKWKPTPALLRGEPHGHKSLADYKSMRSQKRQTPLSD